MKVILAGFMLTLSACFCFGQDYSSFEYVYATAGSPSVRVVTVEFKDAKGVKLKFEHDLDLSRNQLDRTLTLTSGYITRRNHDISFTAHRGYYSSTSGRAKPEVSAVLDQLVELMPATGAGNDLDNDRVVQRRVVSAVLRLNQLLVGSSSSAGSVSHTPNAEWPSFVLPFRAAVSKRDRQALRQMIAIPFSTQEGELRSPDEVLKVIDRARWWVELLRAVRTGAKYTDPSGGGRQRCVTDGIFCFAFGTD